MSLSVETILADARKLVIRLKEHDATADCLVARTQSLQKQLDAMKQDYLNELNEAARHRPRIGLIIALAQENSKIRELQQENQELRQSLDEHQSALELIMSKYREQVSKLVKANNIERSLLQQSMDQSQDLQVKSEKIGEMAAIMNRAAAIDVQRTNSNQQLIKELEFENHLMRQLLQIDGESGVALKDLRNAADSDQEALPASDAEIQTDESSGDQPACVNDDSPFCAAACSTVVRNPRRSATTSDSTTNNPSSTSQDSEHGPSSLPDPNAVERLRERSPPSDSLQSKGDDDDDEALKRRCSKNLAESGASGAVVVDAASATAAEADKSWLRDNCNCSNNNDDAAAASVGTSEDCLNDNAKVAYDELSDSKRTTLAAVAASSRVDVTGADNNVTDNCSLSTAATGSDNGTFGAHCEQTGVS